MDKKKIKKKLHPLFRWGRLVLAIAASILLLNKPVFNAIDEKGLENLRTYKITTRTFEVHHIDYATGLDKLMGTMSLKGLFYGAWAILLGCVVCTLFYGNLQVRILAASITAILAGSYYLLMVYYAIQLSQKFYLIFYPNLIALLPAVILIIMLYIRNYTVRILLTVRLNEEEGLEQQYPDD